jgi:hypothetical protein
MYVIFLTFKYRSAPELVAMRSRPSNYKFLKVTLYLETFTDFFASKLLSTSSPCPELHIGTLFETRDSVHLSLAEYFLHAAFSKNELINSTIDFVSAPDF